MNQHPDEALAARRRKDRPDELDPVQLDWCEEWMPAFARSIADVRRRDADVAKNRELMGSHRVIQRSGCSFPALPRLAASRSATGRSEA